MEIKQNETLEDYYVRKGYYQRIDNVLPPEINPESLVISLMLVWKRLSNTSVKLSAEALPTTDMPF
jgi:hypothetical protein